MSKKLVAEFIGTFWLVLGGCGTAVLAGSQVGWLGVSTVFLLCMPSVRGLERLSSSARA